MILKSIKHWFGVEDGDEVALFEEVNPKPENYNSNDKLKNKRVCPCCGELLHIENFTCIDRDKGEREFVCRQCMHNLKLIKRKAFVSSLKNNCVFTGTDDNVICDFHHAFGKKSFTLSNPKRNSPANVLIEAFKCIVCDSNSHRRIHYYATPEHQHICNFSYKKDHIDAYLLEYYINFIHVCYGYLMPLYGDFSYNQNVYVPNKDLSTKKQIKEARIYLYYLLTIITIREKYLSIEV